jgi:thiamine biosynthesis protein ThiS
VIVTVNGRQQEVADGTTVAQLLSQLRLGPRGVAVEVNLAIVPAATHAERQLAPGDTLEIVTLVGGG